MAQGLGALLVSLGLDAVEFVRGLTKAEQESKNFANKFNRNMQDTSAGVEFLKGAIKGVLAAFSVKQFVDFTKGIIDANDHLFDLSQRTGATVEDLNGLGYAFKLNGASAEAFEKGMQALNKAISEAGSNRTGETAALFKSLGLDDAAKGAGNATQAITKLADVFPRLSEADRAAVSMKLLRDRAGELIPTLINGSAELKRLADEGRALNPVTTEAARLSNEFNDAMDKLALSIKGGFLPAINDALPSLTAFITALADGQRAGLSFAETLNLRWSKTNDLSSLTAEVTALEAAQAKFTTEKSGGGGLLGWLNKLSDGTVGDVSVILAQKKKELLAVQKILTEQIGIGTTPTPGPRIRVADRTPKGPVDDPTKKILEGQIKDLERSFKRQQDLWNTHEHFLKESYQDGQIAISAYYAERRAIIDEGLQNETASLDKRIALERAFADKKTTSLRDRADAENKIAELQDKRLEAQEAASVRGRDLTIGETRAVQQFRDSVEELGIALAELDRNPSAVGDRFDFANRQLAASFAKQIKQGDEEERRLATIGQAKLKGLKDQAVFQDQLSRATEDYSIQLQKLGIAQERINILADSGAITGLQALDQRSKKNAEYVVILEKQLAVLQAIANAPEAKPQDKLNAEQAAVALERLRTETHLVADEFNKVFKDGFSDAVNSVIDGTTSVKDAFRNMAKDITSSLNKIATKEIADKLFGKGGSSGDGLLSGIGKFIEGFLGGSFASGGMPPVGKLSIVGEHGPEVFVPKVAGTIVPNNKLGGTNVISITVNVPQGTSGPSASQIGLETANSVRRVVGRDG